MEQIKDETFELEKQVEITLLQRENNRLQKTIEESLAWKNFIVIAIIGAFCGVIASYMTYQQEYELNKMSQINSFLHHSKLPPPVKEKFRKDHNLFYLSSKVKTKDYSQKEIMDAEKKINKKLIQIEDKVKADGIKDIVIGGIVGALLASTIYFLNATATNFISRSKINRNKIKINEIDAKELKQNLSSEDEKDFFTQLVQINFKYLDQYYLQTQEQADKSFWISAIAAVIGFLIIIAGIIILYNNPNGNPGFVATAAGVISEFIAAVFFYLYNRTILKMSQYHQKLVITQNISLALKTADLLKDSKERY